MQDKYDKRRAFQEAQNQYKQAIDTFQGMEPDSPGYGSELKHVKQEVNEAYQQIQTALTTASEHQRVQLEQFEKDLQGIIQAVNEEQ
ncbi:MULTISPECIES: hypothetical protein [Peribacillus]|uniref:hypothetical protein n=1 Tax=Peribacillus TaxID=2675229 RepID=UPI0035CB6521